MPLTPPQPPGQARRHLWAAAFAASLGAAPLHAGDAGASAGAGGPASSLEQAERALLDGAPERAAEALAAAPEGPAAGAPQVDPTAGGVDASLRRARVDAAVSLARGVALDPRTRAALEAAPAFDADRAAFDADRAAIAEAEAARARQDFRGTTGVVALSLALVLLASTASRELLRPSRRAGGLALTFVAASALAIAADPLLGRLVAVAALVLGLLALAAEGAIRRSALPMRMRVFAVTIALCGAAGLVLAGAARLPLAFWIRVVSR